MTTTPTSAAVERVQTGPGALVKKYQGDIAMVLPPHVKPDQFVRLAQSVLRRDPKLAQVAERNIGSFMSAILKCAKYGLEPGETFHLVVYGNEIVGITDWTGEIEMIYRAGAVSSVKAEVVYRNDEFRYEPGAMEVPEHRPDWFGDRGEMVGVYAYAVMKDGSTSRVVMMSKRDVEKVKAVSKTAKSSSSPWTKWPDRMWRKTAIHQLAKWVPSSAEYRDQLMNSSAAAESVNTIMIDAPSEDYADGPALPTPNPSNDDEVVEAEFIDDEPGAA